MRNEKLEKKKKRYGMRDENQILHKSGSRSGSENREMEISLLWTPGWVI